MIEKTRAIVLSSVRFGDADLIVKCYTETGVRSYMLKNILRSKKGKLKKAYFQPLTLLEITARHNNKGRLNYINDASVYFIYTSLTTDVIKQSIAIFLSEVLTGALREEEPNPQLYRFIEAALQWLETHDKIANFHLLFLLNLTRHLGFYPETRNINASYFNIEEAYFTDTVPVSAFISGENLIAFKTLIGTNFDAIDTLKLHVDLRQKLLEILLSYYEYHLPGFKRPRSLDILKGLLR